MLNSIVERLKEPSTYRGLSMLLGLIGVKVSPAQADSITAAVVAVLAVIEVFRKESNTTPQ